MAASSGTIRRRARHAPRDKEQHPASLKSESKHTAETIIAYFIISSPGMMPQRFAAEGSFSHTLGRCGLSRCHGRGSK